MAAIQIPLAEMARRATKRRRPVILPPIVTTQAQVQALFSLYMGAVRAWHENARLRILPAYSATLAELSGPTRDSVPEVQSSISLAETSAVQAIIAFNSRFPDWADDVQVWNMRKLVSSLKYATNVDLGTMIGKGDMERTLESALAQNVDLVRSVSDDLRTKISGSVFRGLQARTPAREVAKEIAEATGLAKDRALRIASDQTVKLSARLDQERQEQLGITKFKWNHSAKAHPRQEHLARDGKIYEWDSPVGRGDPPGYLPFCGCKAQAVIELDQPLPEDAGERQAIAPPREVVRLPAPSRVKQSLLPEPRPFELPKVSDPLAELEALLKELETITPPPVVKPAVIEPTTKKPRAPRKPKVDPNEYKPLFPRENVNKEVKWTPAESRKFFEFTKVLQDVGDGNETYALGRYQNGAYRGVNGGLRRALQAGQSDAETLAKHSEAALIRTLDDYLSKSKGLPGNTTAFMGVQDIDAIIPVAKRYVGQKFTDGGYRSVALDARVAKRFSGGGSGAIFEVEIPAGTKAVGVDAAIGRSKMYESEVLLERGTTFEILEVGKINAGGVEKTWIKVRLSK